MRPGTDPAVEVLAASAPLTGREPVLGRLKLRLRSLDGGGGGWLGIAGPPGAGVSRVLEEARALGEAGAPGRPLLCVAPAEPGSGPFEALRRALLPWWRAGREAALRPALEGLLPREGGGASALLAWLGAGPLAAPALVPPASVVRAAVEALTAGGLITAEDWLDLDPGSRRLLQASTATSGALVLAGLTHAEPLHERWPGPVWPLEPLSESQVELLLRRWLHTPVTARRLTPELLRRTEGWPGRVVALAQALAQAGVLVRSGRGWSLPQLPRSWAPFEEAWSRRLVRRPQGGAAALRLVEAAALLSEPVDPAWLASAAGVKVALCEQVLAAAAARRHGRAPGRLFALDSERAEVLARLPSARRAQVAARLGGVLSAAVTARPSLEALLARLEVALQGADEAALGASLRAACAALQPLRRLAEPVLRLLARAGVRLAEALPADAGPAAWRDLLAAADLLARHGHAAGAAALLAAGTPPAPSLATAEGSAWLRLASRHALPAERREAAARLEQLLAGSSPAPHLAEAWQALAEAHDRPASAARAAWRAAVRCTAPCDIARRSALHAALGREAERRGRLRAAVAHARRAALLCEAQGDLHSAAPLWGEVGARERLRGRAGPAEQAFQAAVRVWEALGETSEAAGALLEQGRACLALHAYDEALLLLERALAASADDPDGERAAAAHLELARAHRGRGDLTRERAHAALALAHAAGADRLRAQAAVLVCDLRLGAPGAAERLEQSLAGLEAAGLRAEAQRLVHTLVDERLRGGDVRAAARWAVADAADAEQRLSAARVLRLTGRGAEALALLESLGRDASLPVDVRAEAYARLAELQSAGDDTAQAGRSAQSASALLEVPRRSHARDPRLHRLLARVFHTLGARARSVEHRAAARRTLRLPPPSEVTGAARRRLARSLWLDDPRPSARRRVPALAP